LPEIDIMTDPLTATPASATPRDELAHALLDTVLPANYRAADELDHWLMIIAGSAGYLYASCDTAHFHTQDFIGSPDDVAALAALLQKAANIARVLASGIREGCQ